MWKKIGKLFADRRVWVRQILVAGLAGAVSWQVGDLLIEDGGVVAVPEDTRVGHAAAVDATEYRKCRSSGRLFLWLYLCLYRYDLMGIAVGADADAS